MRAQDLIYSYSIKKNTLAFKAKNGSAKIALTKVGQPNGVNLYYNINDTAWTEYTIDDVIDLNQDDEINFKGTQSTFSLDNSNYYKFAMTGIIQSYGNVMALVNKAKNINNSYQFYSLFNGCSSLTTPPELPATVLAPWCYYNMFNSCTNLLTLPSLPAENMATGCYARMFEKWKGSSVPVDYLPATNLASQCYQAMFINCTSLTAVPTLPVTNLVSQCYNAMFQGCTALSSVPSNLLPAVSLANLCYKSMFEGCSKLTALPTLPANVMAPSCYQGMFAGCTSISSIPQNYFSSNISLANSCFYGMFMNCKALNHVPEDLLPAKKLDRYCYKFMFSNCTSLVDAPKLPATKLINNCYESMFNNCSSLMKLDVSFTEWTNAPAAVNGWVGGVNTQNGQFYKYESLSAEYGGSRIPTGWTAIDKEIEIPQTLGFKSIGDTTLSLNKVGTPNTATLNYSINSDTQQTYEFNTSIELNDGDIITFEGENTKFSKDVNNYYQFVFGGAGTISGFGNIMSLLNYSDTCPSCCFQHLFYNCSKLITAPQLPASNLAANCYNSMFENCTSLTTPPVLQAISLVSACYEGMFRGCTALTSIPQLPSYSAAPQCYKNMFFGCTSLTSIPILPTINLANQCFNEMFAGCTGLSSLSTNILPATTMADSCYNSMFSGCINLTSIPNLPATILAPNCYYGMFSNDPIVSLPSNLLSVNTLVSGCYEGMFSGCTVLTSIPILSATTLDNSCYKNMFMNCSSLSSISIDLLPAHNLKSECYEGMFEGCTALTTTPILSATTLADKCYYRMFAGCIGITDAPILPASELALNCYYQMFNSCSNLSSVEINFDDWSDHFRPTIGWLSNVASTGKFTMPRGLEILISEDNIPQGWLMYNKEGHLIENDFYIPLTFTALQNSSIALSTVGTPYTISLQYNKNNTGWQEWSNYAEPIQLATNDTLALSGANDNFNKGFSDYYNFIMTGQLASSGNMNSVINFTQNLTADYCYYCLFKYCSALVSAPKLPSRSVSESCYRSMFDRCTSLTSAPYLPYFDTIANNCFRAMFSHCQSMTKTANHNWDVCMPSCCPYMYEYCLGLTGTVTLPATTLASHCYKGMFVGCQGITDAVISATSIKYTECCNTLFTNCKHLSSITVNFTAWEGTNSTANWVRDVATNGTFYANSTLPIKKGIDNIPNLWVIDYIDQLVDETPLTFTAIDNATILLSSIGSPNTINLQYNKNNIGWFTYFVGDSINLLTNETIAFSGINNSFSKDSSNYYNFKMTGHIASSGNLQSLVNYNKNITNAYAYYKLFQNCSGLLNTPSLYCKTLLPNCYAYMFYNCTSLSSANTFPPVLLQAQQDSCLQMFGRCSSLTVPPNINGSSTFGVGNNAFQGMFEGCTSLVTPPALNFNMNSTAVQRAFRNMFYDCTSLSSITLPSGTNMGSQEAFAKMFGNCISLTSVPELTYNLHYGCYQGMFQGCTGLSTVPSNMLPKLDLQVNCYRDMFSGCTNLLAAPILASDSLTSYCYANMFSQCTSLTSLNVGFTSWDSTATQNWVTYINTTGTFTKPDALSEQYGVSRIPINWNNSSGEVAEEIDIDGLFALVAVGSGVKYVQINKVGSPDTNTFKYVVDHGTDWVSYNTGDTISFIEYIAISGMANTFSKNTTNYYRLGITGSVKAVGNIMSLVNDNNTVSNYMFANMFSGCADLVDASELIFPVNTLSTRCCYNMFAYCTSLTSALQLPAMVIGPSSYQQMFDRCIALKTPPQLPASSLANGCYWAMFRNCETMTSFPELPATTLVQNCYRGIFEACKKVTDAPQLPLATLATDCYRYMYNGCSSLSSINVNFTSWGYCSNWVAGVKNTSACIFTKPSGLSNSRGNNCIPSNWTIVNK